MDEAGHASEASIGHSPPQVHLTPCPLLQALEDLKFVPNGHGVMHRPRDLYDPHSSQLMNLLDMQENFPDREFSTPNAVATLRSLGLRRSLDAEGVLASARSVMALAESDPDAAAQRGSQLFRFLAVQCDSLRARMEREAKTAAVEGLADDAAEETDGQDEWQRFCGSLRSISWVPVSTVGQCFVTARGPLALRHP